MCSVLFADLVGFTPLSESRDPEQVRELLSQYFEATRTVIARYGGVVEKFIGDAVMAVWGTPVATEGDAERAVRAALEVVAAVAELGRAGERAGPGRARAGVVTGEVAVTLGATSEGMVAGDAVNTAARVQSAAEPGSVLVDASTQRLAGGGDRVRRRRRARPEGQERAAPAVAGDPGRVRRRRLAARRRAGGAAHRPRRRAAHDQGAVPRRPPSGASPRLVLVSGPAGVGKSRLGWEFEKYIDGRGRVGVLASRPVPVLRRGRRVLGAGRDRAAAVRDRRGGHRRGRRARSSPRGCRTSSRTRRSAATSGRGWPGCSASSYPGDAADARAEPRGAVRRLAAVLRAARRRADR